MIFLHKEIRRLDMSTPTTTDDGGTRSATAHNFRPGAQHKSNTLNGFEFTFDFLSILFKSYSSNSKAATAAPLVISIPYIRPSRKTADLLRENLLGIAKNCN
mmetsp:Transcript_21912/g.45631  ORF Transcript_21912/g.45631 Transcript_21912/m.45631 type:complete len:102 (+) Transcript_21912:1076-1381(+)